MRFYVESFEFVPNLTSEMNVIAQLKPNACFDFFSRQPLLGVVWVLEWKRK
jgi:hypothetical protein